MNYIPIFFHMGAIASLVISARFSNQIRGLTFALIFIGYCIMIAGKGM